MAFLLYILTAGALSTLWRRFVQKLPLAIAFVLILLPLCFTGRALLGGRVYAPVDMPYTTEPLSDYSRDYGLGEKPHNGMLSDLHAQIIPWRQAVRAAYAQGEWPLWNPYLLGGSILAANAQSAPYDPFNLLALLLPMATSLTYAACMTFFLAGFFTYAFARSHGLRELPSLVAAAGFMFCGTMAFGIGWPLARAWAFLPLVLVGVRFVVTQATLRSGVVLCSGFVLLIFAGHPETVLHVVAVGAVYGAVQWVAGLRDGTNGTKRTNGAYGFYVRPIALAVAAGVVALALTAIHLLPFREAIKETDQLPYRQLRAAQPLPYDASFTRHRAIHALLPAYGGQDWRDDFTQLSAPPSASAGSIVLALALAALVLAPRRLTWFFAALAGFAFIAACDAPPVAQWLHALPLFDIALNDRFVFVATFSLSMLAAIALDARPRAAGAVAVLVCAVGLAWLTWKMWAPQRAAGVDLELMWLVTVAELLPLLIVAGLFVVRPRHALLAIFALVLLQRAVVDGTMYPAFPRKAFYPRVPLIRAMQNLGDAPYRVVGKDFCLIPDAAAMYGLEDARGYEAMTFARLVETYGLWSMPQHVWFNRVDQLSRPFISFLNIRYAVASSETPVPDGWRLVQTDRKSSVFENQRVLPRAFVPRHVRYRNENSDVLREMADATDFADMGWIYTKHYGPHEIKNGPGTVTVRRDGLAFDLDARMERDGWVVISETAWKGWRAYIDGNRAPILYANHAFLGVHVPKGNHRVRLVYRPQSFVTGQAVSVVTLALCVAVFVWRRIGPIGQIGWRRIP
ncbi:MAG TPA: YfhO family protein [Thermoanaerobaculia bacterium]